jgi:hypothetical protein
MKVKKEPKAAKGRGYKRVGGGAGQGRAGQGGGIGYDREHRQGRMVCGVWCVVCGM